MEKLHGKQKRQNCQNRQRTPPPKLSIVVKLSNRKIINGTYVCFNDPKQPKGKLFFKAEKKELCIPTYIDARQRESKIALIEDINDFLRDIHEQALAEFPQWLKLWRIKADEQNPLFNLDEIREEWKYKKEQFGIFRLSYHAGFFSSNRPLGAERRTIVEMEIQDFTSSNSGSNSKWDDVQPLSNS
jgi:hypothetical protein